MRKIGTVYLVGAGPGDPGLITVRGLELLRSADVVVHDALVSGALLAEARAGARLIDVGKRGGQAGAPLQRRALRALEREARAGRRVVRLKGGDPFVFARGSQEAEHLARRRIPFEIVPGVPAAIGASAYAGIPLTDRRLASAVTFVTATEARSKLDRPTVDWSALARAGGTIVVYMGARRIPAIARRLIGGGRTAQTPAAAVSWGTLPRQQVVEGTLATIGSRARSAGLSAPAVLFVGPVVRLRRMLSWFEKRPLFGKKVLITRAAPQAGALARSLEQRGAQVVEVPVIACRPLWSRRIRSALESLGGWDWVLFTSPNGVDAFFQGLERLGRDARALAGARVGAVGPGTSESLKRFGVVADLMAQPFTTEGLYLALKRAGAIRAKSFLAVRSKLATDELARRLTRAGARRVTILPIYTTVQGSSAARARAEIERDGIDLVTFTSASTVENFNRILPRAVRSRLSRRARFVSIGPVTSRAMRRLGLRVWRQARVSSLAGMVSALEDSGR